MAMFPNGTMVKQELLFPDIPNTIIAPIRPASVKYSTPSTPPKPTPSTPPKPTPSTPPKPTPSTPPKPTPSTPPKPTPLTPPKPTPSTPPLHTRSDTGLQPVLLQVGGVEHAYQSPREPKGLVVFLHGCARSIYGGWPPSANPKFFGMPEDVGRTKQCLKEGYAILYVSPHDKKSKCFSQFEWL